MAINERAKSSTMENYLLANEHLVFTAQITHNATPASKLQSSDISNVAVLRTQGLTAQADAIESGIAFTTPVDTSGIFGLLLDEQVAKILKVVVTPSSGTVTVTSGISAGNRLYLNIDSSVDLSATDLSMTIELDYMLKI